MYNQFEFNLFFWFEIVTSFQKNLRDKCYVFFKFLVIKDRLVNLKRNTWIYDY